MNAISKKLLSFVIVLAMVLSMTPVISLPAAAAIPDAAQTAITNAQKVIEDANALGAWNTKEVTAVCPVCGTKQTWKRVGNNSGTGGTYVSTAASGHYYINNGLDYTCAREFFLYTGGKTCLYLNNKTIQMTGQIKVSHELNILGPGAIVKKAASDAYVDTPLIYLNSASGTLNVYGGSIEVEECDTATGAPVVQLGAKGTINIYGGTFKNAGRGEVLYMAASGTVNMYGGEFQGGTGHVVDDVTKGGNVYTDYGTFNMYGGRIYGGNATEGGNIWTDVRPYFYAGEISNGVATGKGGNIYAQGVSVDLNGGTISGGQAENGGNVYHGGTAGSLNVKGATISNGVATGNGGNIYYEKSDSATSGILAASSGTVSGGQAQNGGNIYITNGRTASNTLSGVTVSGGKATSNGGNVYIADGNVNMSKGTISGKNSDGTEIDGYNAVSGGNVYIAEGVTFTLSGGEIKDGKVNDTDDVNNGGGNVANFGTFTMNDGTISGGTATNDGGNVFQNKTNGFVFNGGEIKDGEATRGGNLFARVSFAVPAESTGVISGGTATDGGNLYIRVGTVTLNGGEIKNGEATNEGGNVHIYGASGRKLIVSGGKITGGKATTGGNIYVGSSATLELSSGEIKGGEAADTKGSCVYVYKGTANLSGGTIHGTSDVTDSALLVTGENSLVNLSGNVNITADNGKAMRVISSGTLNVEPGWTGTAYAMIVKEHGWEIGAKIGTTSNEEFTKDYAQCGTYGAEDKWNAGSGFTGSLYLSTGNCAKLFALEDGTLQVAAGAVVNNGTVKAWKKTAAEAIEAATAKGDYLWLSGAVTLADGKEITVDMGGSNNVTISGNGTVNGFDTANDGYNGNGGTLTVNANSTGTITVTPDYTLESNGNRYISLQDENGGYTFHHLDLKLSAVTLRPGTDRENMGMYYKADITCDKILAGSVESYGVVLSLDNMPSNDFMEDLKNDFTANDAPNGLPLENDGDTVRVTSGLLYGFWRQDETAKDKNAANSEEIVYANAYLKIGNEFIMSDTENYDKEQDELSDKGVAWSLRDVLSGINENLKADEEHYAQNKKAALGLFYNTWNSFVEFLSEFTFIAKQANNG